MTPVRNTIGIPPPLSPSIPTFLLLNHPESFNKNVILLKPQAKPDLTNFYKLFHSIKLYYLFKINPSLAWGLPNWEPIMQSLRSLGGKAV